MTLYPDSTSRRGMVSSAHYLASQAGVWMLRQGGNAADAAVCAAATIAVVSPHLNGVGGDVFAQVWPSGATVPVGLNASGRSGSLATIKRVREQGLSDVPDRGPMSISVPGAVSGWQALLNRYGTRRLRDVLEPAIDYADHGAPVTSTIARSLATSRDLLLADAGLAAVFAPRGKLLGEGQVFRNPELARSLRQLSATDGEEMYRGELARKLANGIKAAGGFIERDDLSLHRADWVNSVQTAFAGRDIFELPPNSQGIAALEMLNLAGILDIRGLSHNSGEYVAQLCRVVALAIEDRDQFISDPDFVQVPVDRLVSKEYARKRSSDTPRCKSEGNEADTVYLCVVDEAGMAVSLIQSLYRGFGSGFTVQGTGIHLNNRGSYFSLDRTRVNSLEPRKRPLHTLMPGAFGVDRKLACVFGTMGGDAQPQIHLQVLLNHLVFGMGLQKSIEAPRFVWSPTPGRAKRVLLEGRFTPETVKGLTSHGYSVEIVEDWSSQMGHAQAIALQHGEFRLIGAADPRSDGAAIAY